jgi:hypothetical protein
VKISVYIKYNLTTFNEKSAYLDLVVDDADARLLDDFVQVMERFEEATKMICSEQEESASLLIPMFQALRTSCSEEIEGESDESVYLRGALRKSVDFYLKKYDYMSSNCLAAITYLDPRYI